jgi:large subunit ribosomal protein L25
MADSVSLSIEPREGKGTQGARKLRRTGKVPGVIYGHKEATVSVVLSTEDLDKALRSGARVVDLKIGGKTEKALISEVQRDHLGMELIHVDFKRVSADERVTVGVRVELRGQSPGVTAGGILDQPIHVLSVECLVTAVPDSIRVNVDKMQIGSVLHVKDITLPAGVTTTIDPDSVIVQVKAPVADDATAAAPGEVLPGAAEPEVITRKAPEAEPEEEKK